MALEKFRPTTWAGEEQRCRTRPRLTTKGSLTPPGAYLHVGQGPEGAEEGHGLAGPRGAAQDQGLVLGQPSVQEGFVADGVQGRHDDVRGRHLVGLHFDLRHLGLPRRPLSTDGHLDTEMGLSLQGPRPSLPQKSGPLRYSAFLVPHKTKRMRCFCEMGRQNQSSRRGGSGVNQTNTARREGEGGRRRPTRLLRNR